MQGALDSARRVVREINALVDAELTTTISFGGYPRSLWFSLEHRYIPSSYSPYVHL